MGLAMDVYALVFGPETLIVTPIFIAPLNYVIHVFVNSDVTGRLHHYIMAIVAAIFKINIDRKEHKNDVEQNRVDKSKSIE